MNYQKHYTLLINRAKNRIIEGYKESHHILPRCMGGSDDPENLVNLTAEEHYIAHQLLIKIHPNVHGLIYAVHMMGAMNNKKYGWIRHRFSKSVGENNKKRIWKESSKQKAREWISNNNPMDNPESVQKLKNLIWINNGITSRRIPNTETLPKGFVKGRLIPNNSKKGLFKQQENNMETFIEIDAEFRNLLTQYVPDMMERVSLWDWSDLFKNISKSTTGQLARHINSVQHILSAPDMKIKPYSNDICWALNSLRQAAEAIGMHQYRSYDAARIYLDQFKHWQDKINNLSQQGVSS